MLWFRASLLSARQRNQKVSESFLPSTSSFALGAESGVNCAVRPKALGEDGFREAILWVWEDNARARRLYEAKGWRTDKTRAVEMLEVEVPEVRYRKPL
jgi:hypothetical protein